MSLARALVQPLACGVNEELEEQADAIIRDGEWRWPEGILCANTYEERLKRETQIRVGIPDSSLYLGMYRRARDRWHPWKNSRDGLARHRHIATEGETRYDIDGTLENGQMSPYGWAMILPVSSRGEISRAEKRWPHQYNEKAMPLAAKKQVRYVRDQEAG